MKPNRKTNNQENFWWQIRHVFGFMLCIILTAASLWATFYSGYEPKLLFIAIAVLAFVQALIQLFQVDLNN
ncbi:hypothetical protein CFK37_17570 [Virgibacillus phasianinus]|uniref:Uncharacterized protein n=1 Tax=Virgibacillus phasianinus TaxID=2017483 RepID=A0A220U6R1_9BACI|nr:hypothetical protein [Virgibacillus phasianinus]ASK63838.1 hypothetical protein CFK37_17570 [Virgibacillus phasianinus]